MTNNTRDKDDQQARQPGGRQLDIESVEILMGYRPGSAREKEELADLKGRLGEHLYVEIVFTLIHQSVPDMRQAREVFNGIVRHKKRLEELLGRDIAVQVAALDYARAVHNILDNPLLQQEEKLAELSRFDAHRNAAKAYDKGALLADLKKEVERTRRYGHTFSVVFIDVDNLKAINDTYGHAAGDFALARLTTLLKENLRAVDAAYRFGGDEFVVQLPNSDIDVARKVAEKLMKKIRATEIIYGGAAFHVTVSIGLESFDDQTVQNVEDVLNTVDSLLYEAKQSGKNRISMPAYEQTTGTVSFMPSRPQAIGENERFIIHGISISEDIALGRAYIHEDILNDVAYEEIADNEIPRELIRLRSAIAHVSKDVEHMEKQVRLNLGQEYANIFAVHRAILSDTSLIDEMESKLKTEKRNAEHVIRNIFKHFETRFISSENAVMRERSLDIADLGRRLLRHLAGETRNIFAHLPKGSIVVAKRLLPSESVHLRRGNVAGIVTEKGSRNSHAAILARGLGIPYVSETDYPIEKIRQNALLIVNADTGEVIVNPTQEDKETVRSAIEIEKQENRELIECFKNVELKKDDRRIQVMANVGTMNSMREAVEFGCDGIGLYRIEQIYMQSKIFPTQEQLYRMLDELFGLVKDKEIVARLLDIGGDKTLPYFPMSGDLYSVLGVRGVRFLLRYPRILETQLTALLKLSDKYRLSILIPMVTLPDEITAIRGHLERCKRVLERYDVPFAPDVKLGAMIEVPAAVLKINDILKNVDFLSIGTNDLIQYTMASARENAALSRYYEAGTNMVLHYIGHTLEQSRRHGIPCSICGELAAYTAYTGQLLNMGLDIFSVSPANILKVKSKLADLLTSQPAPV